MFGSYAHTEGEDDSVSASGTFDLASLVGTTKHKRRLGSGNKGTMALPVRMGASGKKVFPTPTRRVTDPGHGSVVTNLGSKLAAIDEDVKKRDEQDVHKGEVSLSDLLGGLGLSTPSQGVQIRTDLENKHHRDEVTAPCKEGPGDEEKVSPDSGSFTMSATKTRAPGKKDLTGDFTDSLPAPSQNTSARNRRLGPSKPVKMTQAKSGVGSRLPPKLPAPVRSQTIATDRKLDLGALPPLSGDTSLKHQDRDKENVPELPQESVITRDKTATSSIQHRLQALSSGSAPPLARAQTLPPGHHELTPAKPPPLPATQTPMVTPMRSSSMTPMMNPIVNPMVTPMAAMPPPSTRDKVLTVRGKRYRVMKLLGKGGSSRVYEAFDEEKNTVVAIKRVDLSDADESQREGFINEINMLHKLQGLDRIIKLFDYENVADEAEELLYVVMEKGDTDLASLLKKYASNKELTPAMIKHYWAEMLHAVACIHKNGIIHKDLKPANFMLVAGRLKLIDFGIASSIQSDKTSITIFNQMGTFNYMSPESIQDHRGPQLDRQGNRAPCIKISCKTDVWSLGCILYQLTFGKLPFAHIKHPLMKLEAITNVEHVIEYPVREAGVEDERLVAVIRSCLEREPRRRPGVEELLSHAYLTNSSAPQAAPPTHAAVDRARMLQQLEGVLSPNTFKKTREGFKHLQMKE